MRAAMANTNVLNRRLTVRTLSAPTGSLQEAGEAGHQAARPSGIGRGEPAGHRIAALSEHAPLVAEGPEACPPVVVAQPAGPHAPDREMGVGELEEHVVEARPARGGAGERIPGLAPVSEG